MFTSIKESIKIFFNYSQTYSQQLYLRGYIMESNNATETIPQITIGHKSSDNRSRARLLVPERYQVEIRTAALDDMIADDHQVRFIWEFVNKLDFSKILNKIKSVENGPGRSATDPRIFLSLWILAIIEGIGSARTIERYCDEHLAFKWLCGGVSVNYHSISDFRTNHGEELDNLLTESVAILMHKGLVNLKRVSQDGMKVKAHAGKGSFHREPTLKDSLKIAKEQLVALNKELASSLSDFTEKMKAAKRKAAEQRVSKIQESLNELEQYRQQKEKALIKERKKLSETAKQEMRTSTTDPECRKMQMNDKGHSPAYNIQFATDHKNRAIVGFDVTNNASDYGQLSGMLEQIQNRYARNPDEILADSGYFSHADIEKASKIGKNTLLYVPPRNPDSYLKTKGKSKVIIDLEQRMINPFVKTMYKERASTAEWTNAMNRNRGLWKFCVVGLKKVKSVVCLFAITHNMLLAYYN